MNLKSQLDAFVETYEVKDFIKEDPIQFCHRFKDVEDIEIAGFIASMFAFGNRKVFIKKLEELFIIFENEPKNFIINFDGKNLNGFNYRFAKEPDIISVLTVLKKLYKEGSSLQNLFKYGFDKRNTDEMFKVVTDYFYANIINSRGAKYLIPCAYKKGAMKRMNMFLRWMVRHGEVDLGIWKFIKKNELLIPLDVHVARVSRSLGLLNRASNDFKAVIELTKALKFFDKDDPVKYDFALFGFGINEMNKKRVTI